MCFNWGAIFTLNIGPLKLVEKLTYFGSSVSSTKCEVNIRVAKAWTAFDRKSFMWKTDLTNKIKLDFFHAVVVLILQYGCTTETLTKIIKKRLDGICTKMLWAILKETWEQQPTKKKMLYGHLPRIWKTIQEEDDQQELTNRSSVRTKDAT